jgi:mutator protein MutT
MFINWAFSVSDADDFFLREGPLTPGDAAVALIVLEDSRYLMQLRDQKPGIFFPGHWGLFGGGIEEGETPEAALRRELQEEIGVVPQSIAYFTRYSFDFGCHGSRRVDRHYYEARILSSALKDMKLMEGAEMRAFDAQELLGKVRVTPYDAFAIWMHATRTAYGRKHL